MHWLKTSARELRHRVGGPGHTPCSCSQPFYELLENDIFLNPEFSRQKLTEQNMLGDENTTIYCGSGIAVTINSVTCNLMGKDNVSVHNSSLTDWYVSATRPIKLGSCLLNRAYYV